ncbi:ribonuclease H-like domain-containing protein [Tanacetum coccineum]|uniref:Ribonuclease H-like domain-containing protein n=1 Tax=Tanacetum coccineum TaxID=301880 RepID=A0ABQ5GDD3_9ASTR
MATRSQSGIVKPIDRLSLHTSSIPPILKSPFIALKGPNWCNAMYDEYNSLVKNGTWILVPWPSNVNLVRSMWLFKHKFHADGTLSRYKTRLIANGSNQQHGVDFDETFSYATRAGFSPSRCDSSLFIYTQGSHVAYLLIYVDDIILTASSLVPLQQIVDSLHKEFDMTDLEALNYFLGISAVRHPTWLFLSQKKYTLQLLECAHLVNCNPSRITVDTDSKLGPDDVHVHDPTLYRSLGTLELGLHLYASATTAEAEYQGVANVIAETAWIRNLLHELHSPLLTATLVYCDNVSAVYMSANPVQHQRTKHIEIDIHLVRDLVKAGHVRVLHVPSRFQYVDIFTKGLPSSLFEDFQSSLSVRPLSAQTVGAY